LAVAGAAVLLGLGWWFARGEEPVPEVAERPTALVRTVASAARAPDSVRCPNTLGLPDGTHELLELLGEGQGRQTEAFVRDGEVELAVSLPAGHGGIYPIGWERAVVAWENGRCRFLDEARPMAAVVGVVEGGDGLPPFALGVSNGKGKSGRRTLFADADGGFFLEVPAREPVLMSAVLNGDWPNAGPEVEVVPSAERDTVVTLTLPDSVAGIGVVLEEDGDTIRDVMSGTPAARAGLRAGDVVVEVEPPDLELEVTRVREARPARWVVRGRDGEERTVEVR
jgi:hypothetical protein